MTFIDPANNSSMQRMVEVSILNRSKAKSLLGSLKPGQPEYAACESLIAAWSAVERLAKAHRTHADAYVDPEWFAELASAAGTTAADLKTTARGYSRSKIESDARSMISWYLCRYKRGPKLSMPNAARTMGMRSHASVHEALSRLDLLDKEKFDEFKKRLSVDEVL